MSPKDFLEGNEKGCHMRAAESATGIRAGGRTGITGLTIAFWFFVSLWFTPIFGALPPAAPVTTSAAGCNPCFASVTLPCPCLPS